MQDFRNLKVWQKAHPLVLDVYRATRTFPKDELYGLVSQMRRSAMSIPTNIAEGCGRQSDPDFVRFLVISNGSTKELDYQLLLSKDLGYIDETNYQNLHSQADEVGRMLNGLINSINSKPQR